jgi:dTDP-4-dehydrorhamnose 3,5-epimerase
MIEGVQVKQLEKHVDERGYLMELLRSDDTVFDRFGQCYVSLNYPGVVRAWHYHKKQDDHFVVVSGTCRVGLFDMREGSPTRGEVNEFFLGSDNNILLKIPVGVAHGYKTIGVEPSLLLNFPTEVYDPKEPDEHRLSWDTEEIPFNWEAEFR